MSVAHDRQFQNQFNLTIGMMAGVVVGMFFLAIYLANQPAPLAKTAEYTHQVAERVAPAARVAVAGQDNSALTITPGMRILPAGPAVTMPHTGTEVFEQVCVACHGQGIGGAPRAGDTAAWSARVAKGKSTLYRHAIEGFKGENGQMPPKGGRTDIPDDLIQAAVDQMVAASR